MYEVFIDNCLNKFNARSEMELLNHFPDHRWVEAAGGLIEDNGKFLFILRHGLWDIPKGKCEKGEKTEDCAVREVEEETGVRDVRITMPLCTTWHTYEQKGKRHLKKSSWYLMTAGDISRIAPQTEESITETAFFSQNEFDVVRNRTYGSILSVLDALVKAIRN